jgi:hypothetical protein
MGQEAVAMREENAAVKRPAFRCEALGRAGGPAHARGS